MKVTFDFDGEYLRLFLRTEDDAEKAVAKLMETYNIASVSLSYSDTYSGRNDYSLRGVDVVLRKGRESA